MILLDSSCWVEYFFDGKHAETYASLIESNRNKVLVPAIVLHEVFKVVLRLKGENDALAAASGMQQFSFLPMDENTAMFSAKIGVEHGLAMADSMVLAAARIHNATLWTQDADFADIEGVRHFRKSTGI